ncbi:MAG: PDZ domain-containing protein, partial [Phaeobacter italicus]
AVPAAATKPEADRKEEDVLGMTITLLTPEMREELGVDEDMSGLVVLDIDETSEAFEKGLRAGDLITEVGQQKVTSISQMDDQITAARDAGRKSLLLLVRRGGDPRFVALNIEE